MKTLVAALVGAVCAAGWQFSFTKAFDLPCDSGPLACTFRVLLFAGPVLAVLWAVVAWGLLRLLRYSPAWPTALAGTLIAIVLAYVVGLVLIHLPRLTVFVFVPVSGALGYALASAATAGYRGRRDGAEHRGQDG